MCLDPVLNIWHSYLDYQVCPFVYNELDSMGLSSGLSIVLSTLHLTQLLERNKILQ